METFFSRVKECRLRECTEGKYRNNKVYAVHAEYRYQFKG
jgi:hypothetical protein